MDFTIDTYVSDDIARTIVSVKLVSADTTVIETGSVEPSISSVTGGDMFVAYGPDGSFLSAVPSKLGAIAYLTADLTTAAITRLGA